MQGPTLGVLGYSAFQPLPSYSLGRGLYLRSDLVRTARRGTAGRLVDLRFTCALRPSLSSCQ